MLDGILSPAFISAASNHLTPENPEEENLTPENPDDDNNDNEQS